MRCLKHPVRPPVPKPPRFEQRRPQPVKEAIGDRLQRTLAGRLDVDPHRDAVLDGAVGRLRTTLGKPVQRRLPEARIRRTAASVDSGCSRSARACARRGRARHRRGSGWLPAIRRIPRGSGGARRDRSSSRPRDGREVVLPGRRPRRPAGRVDIVVLLSPTLGTDRAWRIAARVPSRRRHRATARSASRTRHGSRWCLRGCRRAPGSRGLAACRTSRP